jgi:hypothetical protein
VLLCALEEIQRDDIKVVLTPMPVRAGIWIIFGSPAMRGNVTVFPMRMKEGFAELQAGSTFGLMRRSMSRSALP